MRFPLVNLRLLIIGDGYNYVRTECNSNEYFIGTQIQIYLYAGIVFTFLL